MRTYYICGAFDLNKGKVTHVIITTSYEELQDFEAIHPDTAPPIHKKAEHLSAQDKKDISILIYPGTKLVGNAVAEYLGGH